MNPQKQLSWTRWAFHFVLLGGGLPAQALTGVTELLAVLPEDDQAGLVGSVDPRGFNDDGFTGSYIPYQVGSIQVLFDEKGPGELLRIHKAFWSSILGTAPEHFPLYFFVDDHPQPLYTLDVQEIFNGNGPFHPPLRGGGVGGDWAYVSIPFRSRLQILAPVTPGAFGFSSPATFFEFGFRRGRTRGDAPAWAQAASLQGSWPHGFPPQWTPPLPIGPITPGQAATVAAFTGPGTILGLEFGVGDPSADWRRVFIEITWDDQVAPAVRVPLGMLMGVSRPVYPVSAVMFHMDANGLRGRCYFPMPFRTSAVIRLVNPGPTRVSADASWVLRPGPYPEPFGHFCARYAEKLPTVAGTDFRVAHIRGTGRYVGTVLEAESLWSWLGSHTMTELFTYAEGDPRIYVDGSETPLHGCATEVYFNWSWYGHPCTDQQFTKPFHGYSGVFGAPAPGNDTAVLRSFHRLHLVDAIPFYSELRFELEHGGVNDSYVNYRSAALFYDQEQPALVLADTVEVGDPASEAAHGYAHSGVPMPSSLVSRYWGDATVPTMSDTGREIPAGTSVTFLVSVPPTHKRVRLRARIDQESGPCDALVHVGGVFAGNWYRSVSNPHLSDLPFSPHRRWADIEFEIVPALTLGQTLLPISVTPLGPGLWREFRYDVFVYP